MNVRLPLVFSFVVASCISGFATGQEQKQNQTPNTKAPNGAQVGEEELDHHLAACLAIDNQKEIAFSRFAGKTSTNDEVRDFAAMMVADHSKFLKKLAAFVPDLTRDELLTTSLSEASDTTSNSRLRDEPQRGVAADRSHSAGKAGRIKLEVAQACLRSAESDLGEKRGAEFDKCFMTVQVLAHKEMAGTLKVFEKHASADLAKLIKEAQSTTREHLEHAEKLAKRIEDAYVRTAAREANTKE